jgi:hypothetical protein
MNKSRLLETKGGKVTVEAMDAAEAFLEAEAAGRSGEATQGIKAAIEANVSNCDSISHAVVMFRIVL